MAAARFLILELESRGIWASFFAAYPRIGSTLHLAFLCSSEAHQRNVIVLVATVRVPLHYLEETFACLARGFPLAHEDGLNSVYSEVSLWRGHRLGDTVSEQKQAFRRQQLELLARVVASIAGANRRLGDGGRSCFLRCPSRAIRSVFSIGLR